MLKGRKGIGKYQFACQLCKSYLCTNRTKEWKACGDCMSCRWFDQNSHPDFLLVMSEALQNHTSGYEKETSVENADSAENKKNGSQQISIEQIRKLSEFIYMTSHQNGFRVVMIYPAETMNAAAANALLKKLEEPPDQVLFVLVTHQVQQLLPTVLSRCQQVSMPAPDQETSTAWLKQHAIQDPVSSLAFAGYAPITALSLEQEGEAGQLDALIGYLSGSESSDLFALINVIESVGLPSVLAWLQKWCYDLVSVKTAGKVRYYVRHSSDITLIAHQIDVFECLAYAQHLNLKSRWALHSLNRRLVLEEILLEYHAMLRAGG